jgi:small subunit ribosomal protein S17
MTDTATAPAQVKGQRKEFVGRVVSNKMQKTVVVAVNKTSHHPLYKRAIRVTKKYYAHDEQDSLQIGDVVRIVETRPLSKLKRWRVAEVVRASQGPAVTISEPTEVLAAAAEAASAAAASAAETAAAAAGTVAETATSAAATVAGTVAGVVGAVAEAVTEVVTGEDETEAEEKPAPSRRRAAAKADASASSATASPSGEEREEGTASPDAEASADEKPARRRRAAKASTDDAEGSE